MIRKTRVEDLDEIFLLGKNEKYFCGFWPKEDLKEWLDSEDDVTLIYEENGKIISFILATYSKFNKKVIIENIFTDIKYRKKGFAKELIFELEKEYKEKGAKYLSCIIDVENKASIEIFSKSRFELDNKNYSWPIKFI